MTFRLTAHELELIRWGALFEGVTLSEYIRMSALKRASAGLLEQEHEERLELLQ